MARLSRGVYVVHQDELRDLFARGDDYLGGRVADAGDPRGTGLGGLRVSDRVSSEIRKLVAKKMGLYRAVVRKPTVDVWSGGWEVKAPKALKDELERLDRETRVWPTLRGVKAAFRMAHERARRDGRSLVWYRLKDSTGDTSLEPKGVQKLAMLHVVPHDRIKKVVIDTDPASDRWLEPREFHVWMKKGDDSTLVKIHWQRAHLFVQEPDDDAPGDDVQGESELAPLMDGAQGVGNIRWAGTEAMFQRAAPYLVVKIDSDAEMNEDDDAIKKLDERVSQLQSGVIQKIRIHNAEISTLSGSEKINDPTPFIEMWVEDAAASSGIPKRELTGSEAGALEAAQWDQRRYDSSVVSPLRDEFATGYVLEHYARLRAWGLVKAAGEIEGIEWFSFVQLDQASKGPFHVQVAVAAKTWVDLVGAVPKELQAEVTLPEGIDLDKIEKPTSPVPLSEPRDNPSGAPNDEPARPPASQSRGMGIDATKPASRLTELPVRVADAGIEVDETLARLEARMEHALKAAIVKWRRGLDATIEKTLGKRLGLGDRLKRLARGVDDVDAERVARAVLHYVFTSDELAPIVEQVLLEAAQHGATKTWTSLGRQGILEFIDTPDSPILRQYARDYSRAKAEAATRSVRDAVAGAMAQNKNTDAIREVLVATFDGIENASTIARTEAMKGYNVGALTGIRGAGIQQYRFVAFAGADEECAALDGRTFAVTDTTTLPPIHPNCRCAIVASFPGELEAVSP